MTLISLLLLACQQSTECKEIVFDASGTYELSTDGEVEYSTTYRDDSEIVGTYVSDTSDVAEAGSVVASFDERSNTVNLDGVIIELEPGSGDTCDTSDSASVSSSDSASVSSSENPFGPAGWSGQSLIGSGPSGTLSAQVSGDGFDLGGNDCHLSYELSVVAHYNATGSEFSDRFIQTLYLDDSASCREALLTLQEQMLESSSVPTFFFNWSYVDGINLSKIDQLRSMTTAVSILGSRSSEDSVTTDAPPTTAPPRTRAAKSQGLRSLMRSELQKALKPIR